MIPFISKPKNDARDLEQIIFDIAEHHRDEDFQVFCRLMLAKEVYLPVDKSTVPTAAKPGALYVTQSADRVTIKTVSIPNNGQWIAAATQTTHPLLAAGYCGMPWVGFLQMAQKISDVRGALIQGKTSWIALDKQRIANIVSRVESDHQ